MDKPGCAVDGCDREAQKREWCRMHYNRLLLAGEIKPLPKLSLSERLWAKVDKSGDYCWEWTGSRDKNGYGKILIKKDGRPQATVAHRLAYILEYGPIPDDIKVDHRCHNTSCVRLDHLRAVTHKQNLENRAGAQRNNTTSGIRGVCWHKRMGKWVAAIKHDGTVLHIGYFDDLEAAERAVIARRNELFTHNDMDRLAAPQQSLAMP